MPTSELELQPSHQYPAWYYNELQQVGTDFEAIVQVAAYDRNQALSRVEAEQQLVARLGISAGHRTIDIGCGTGTFAIQAALAGAYVDAVDVSQAMLAHSRAKAEAAGALARMQFHHGGFLTYEHRADPVDLIVTKSALHHLPDFWKMVALLRMAKMLKNGGLLYLRDTVFSFQPEEYQTAIDRWIARVAKPDGEGWTVQDLETHVREEYTTFGWILEGMLTQAGFQIEAANYLTPEYAEYVCRKREKD
jgi:putative AdoMet-dependent methyltransferase